MPAVIRTEVLMGTVVRIEVLSAGAESAVDRAFGWFREVEARCTRFNPDSELMQVSRRIGTPVQTSPIVFEAIRFALAVAEDTGGAFDPTVGLAMETRGFNREYSTGAVRHTALESNGPVSFRDVRLDAERSSVTLLRPLLLDLGAVAKGLAVDTAARELREFGDFAIDAGGDLYLGGHNATGAHWSVGIRHPRLHDQMVETIQVSNAAVCTSGDYERRDAGLEGSPHILNPRSGEPAMSAISVSVIAETAMLADALATAAFVLGPVDGVSLLERTGVEGVIFSPSMERFASKGFPGGAH